MRKPQHAHSRIPVDHPDSDESLYTREPTPIKLLVLNNNTLKKREVDWSFLMLGNTLLIRFCPACALDPCDDWMVHLTYQMTLSAPFSLVSFQKLADFRKEMAILSPKASQEILFILGSFRVLGKHGSNYKNFSISCLHLWPVSDSFHGQQDPCSFCPCDTLLAAAPVP